MKNMIKRLFILYFTALLTFSLNRHYSILKAFLSVLKVFLHPLNPAPQELFLLPVIICCEINWVIALYFAFFYCSVVLYSIAGIAWFYTTDFMRAILIHLRPIMVEKLVSILPIPILPIPILLDLVNYQYLFVLSLLLLVNWMKLKILYN